MIEMKASNNRLRDALHKVRRSLNRDALHKT